METKMRKPRDFDSELKALTDKAAMLKARKVQQLGELVIATNADTVDPETLAGALLDLAETKDPAKREKFRARGATFFREGTRGTGNRLVSNIQGDPAKQDGGAAG